MFLTVTLRDANPCRKSFLSFNSAGGSWGWWERPAAPWGGQGREPQLLSQLHRLDFSWKRHPEKHLSGWSPVTLGAQSTAEIKCSFGLTWVIDSFSDVQLSSKFTSAGWIAAFHVLVLNYMLHMLQHKKFDFSNASKWLQNWPLVNNSPAAFPCNYFAREFNL